MAARSPVCSAAPSGQAPMPMAARAEDAGLRAKAQPNDHQSCRDAHHLRTLSERSSTKFYTEAADACALANKSTGRADRPVSGIFRQAVCNSDLPELWLLAKSE